MLIELRVRNLGVIEDAVVSFGPGLTAITGETGAGKTMILDALSLLMGGPADSGRVRPGAERAIVEGVFAILGEDGDEVEQVVRREVPAAGRSRALVDGDMATAAMLAELGGPRVEIHGQHGQQRLLRGDAQREALDRFGRIDSAPYREALRHERTLGDERERLGGDERARLREIDLIRFQLDELTDAAIESPDELDDLIAEERLLADAEADAQLADRADDALSADGGARDAVAVVAKRLSDADRFAAPARRLNDIVAELADVIAEVRSIRDTIDGDPESLARVQDRRAELTRLCRKYGDTLGAVIEERDRLVQHLNGLEHAERRASEIDAELARAEAHTADVAGELRRAREGVADQLADELTAHVKRLGLGAACVAVHVGDDRAGQDVELRLATVPGAEPGPLSKVASGGELSRVMLALQLVLSGGPATLVFDEVDAGIGGETAMLVGRALRDVSLDAQVIVVTHLAQVAVHADHQVVMTKSTDQVSVTTRADAVVDDDRIIELSRMMTGSPDSDAARDHARELLAQVGKGAA